LIVVDNSTCYSSKWKAVVASIRRIPTTNRGRDSFSIPILKEEVVPMCNNTRCPFAITDIVDVDENIEVMLFCSYHDCLPEDAPADCDPEKQEAVAMDEYTNAMADYYLDEQAKEYEDEVPF
jgi:hypothetical protein